ncbi:hypothetical protein FJY90_02115 [Candidatus Gottesmanbacteria bacterium]|nr:hypothetical protein [Candidatus Gottesmanbacteria bacterium]
MKKWEKIIISISTIAFIFLGFTSDVKASTEPEYGLFNFWATQANLNELYPNYNFKWIFTSEPDDPPQMNRNLVLDYYGVTKDLEQDNWPKNCNDLKIVENRHKSVPAGKFWGIDFIREEIDKTWFSKLDNNANCAVFGENILGYNVFKDTAPYANEESWKDEMYFRVIRGFYNHIKSRNPPEKIGITMGGDLLTWWQSHVGEKAMNFIKTNYDYVIFYSYTKDLGLFRSYTKPMYLTLIDDFFSKQKKFWIVSRNWPQLLIIEPEIIQLEVKNALDRNIVVLSYGPAGLDPPEVIDYMAKSVDLYKNAPGNYHEEYTGGVNMITGKVGNTYGFVRPFSPGDANKDGRVDSEDFALLAEDYLKTPAHNTDFNSDGRVDSEDFAILQLNYLK